ncbi:MAG: hypothetical protein KF838_15460 [Phycisphaeraceae bacterium]|nr:MAG: hypothetical protein KF838_15460 [Phycisphaeraceae bacterium]
MARDPTTVQPSRGWRKWLLWAATAAVTVAIVVPGLLMTVPRYLPVHVECLPDGTARVVTKRDGVLSQGFPALFEHRVPVYTRLESGELLNRYRLKAPPGADQIHGALLPTEIRQTWWLGYRVAFSDIDFSHPPRVDPMLGFLDRKRDAAVRYWW